MVKPGDGDQPRVSEAFRGVRKLTQTAPQATAELDGQIAVLLQQLRADLVERDALDAHILGRRVAIGVALLVGLGPPDGIVGGQRRDDGVAGRENRGGRRGAEQRGEDGLSEDAHSEDFGRIAA